MKFNPMVGIIACFGWPRSTLLWAAVTGLLIFVAAWSGIELTRGSERIATIWLANAVLLTIMFKMETRAWPVLFAGGYLGNVAANVLSGDALPLAFTLSACNTLEVFLVAVPLRHKAGHALDLSRLPQLGAFVLLAGVVSPALVGAIAAMTLAYWTSASPSTVWMTWYPADALGFLILTPLLLMLRRDTARTLLRTDRRFEAVAWLLALIAATAAVFNQSAYPLLFLPMALLSLIGVRLGSTATALGVVLVALAAIAATVLGHGPMMLVQGDLTTRVFVLQCFLATTVLAQLPLTALLSEQLRLTTDLRRNEAFLRGVIDGSGDCIKVLDLEGHLRFISRNGLCLMEIDDPQTVLGKSFVEMWPDETRAEVAAALLRAQSGEPARITAAIATAKGSMLQVDVLISPIQGADGEPENLVAIARDITHLRAAQTALHEKSMMLEATLEAMDQGLLLVDADGCVPVANRRALELLELPVGLMASRPEFRVVREHQRRAKRWGDRIEGIPNWTLNDYKQSTDVRYERRSADGYVLEIRTVPMHAGGVVQTFTDITHLKRAEDAAREAEMLFRGLFDHATDHLFVHKVAADGSFCLETCNPGAAMVMGLRTEDLCGKTPEDVLPPEAAAIVRADIERTIEQGQPRRFEDEQVLEAGRKIWEIIHVPLREPTTDGRITRVFASARDITHLRAAEMAAREANRLLLLAEKIAHVGHWRLAVPSNILTWSDETYHIYGVDRLSYNPILEIAIEAYHPDDRAEVSLCVARAVAQGEGFDFSMRLVRADGAVREVMCRGLCETDQSGEVTALVGTLMDVTEMRRAERAVVESEARYRLLADNASDLIMLDHADGRRSYVSPAVQPMLGYTVGEAYHVTMRDWVHPDDLGSVIATKSALSTERPTAAIIYRLRRKDGFYIWAEAAFRRVEDDAGVRIITAIRDVSERQRQADELRMAKETAELAKTQADYASQAKTDFLAAMSHEIRTPLNSIIGFTGLILDAPGLPPQVRRQAELIRSSGSTLEMVVNDILDFSQVEAGAIELDNRPFSLAALADSCVSILQTAADAKRLEISFGIDPNIPGGLVGDEGRLRQILLNLLNNAVKFTRQGCVALSVSHERSSVQGETVRFSVADTGIGIPLEKQHRLFQRFSQVDGSIRRDFGGTGLGLAISKSLVELMGGGIGVQSEDGRGSTFWFTLTLPRGRMETHLAEAPPPPLARKCGRLLLVEDVEINQELGRLVLEAAGHVVDVVADGAAAVMAVEDEVVPYDLVLMDIQMPGMDGMTATRLIRRLQSPRRKVAVIAMTANVLPEQVRAFREAGIDDHVGKPFDRSELYTKVDRWLPEHTLGEVVSKSFGETSLTNIDHDTFDKLADFLGRDTVEGLLGTFARELRQRFIGGCATEDDRIRLKRDAHATLPAAGLLGFQELTMLCAGLDETNLDEQEFEFRLTRLKTLRDAVLSTIETFEPAPRIRAAG